MTVQAVMGALPGRERLREVALASVANQVDVAPTEVLWGIDHAGVGCGAMKNRGLERATAGWCAFIDDDDWWFPRHLRTLLDGARGADLVYTLPVVWEGPRRTTPWPRSPFDPDRLFRENYIPCGYMVRREMALAVGGFPERTPEVPYSDWGFLLRLLETGAEFRYIEEWTWAFRRHAGNTSSWGPHTANAVGRDDDSTSAPGGVTMSP